MDANVIAAMAKWPDVPAVFGWLSLTESGRWRLHPTGDALAPPEPTTGPPGDSGEAITSPQVLTFIDRNYSADDDGQWFFQNGPQRVYVRLDAAPFVVNLANDTATNRLKLRTHTGLDIRSITAGWLDDTGRVYFQTDRGPCLMAGRDLAALLDAVNASTSQEGADKDPSGTDAGDVIAQALETRQPIFLHSTRIDGFSSQPILLHSTAFAAVPGEMGFRRWPQPPPGLAGFR